ncbi:hypothetical protein BC829DRAFT_225840 [Chytridium lagenaria]|nr:hypothetical protein BC829DRAFT_225840 [Chytridium lagenaria]
MASMFIEKENESKENLERAFGLMRDMREVLEIAVGIIPGLSEVNLSTDESSVGVKSSKKRKIRDATDDVEAQDIANNDAVTLEDNASELLQLVNQIGQFRISLKESLSETKLSALRQEFEDSRERLKKLEESIPIYEKRCSSLTIENGKLSESLLAVVGETALNRISQGDFDEMKSAVSEFLQKVALVLGAQSGETERDTMERVYGACLRIKEENVGLVKEHETLVERIREGELFVKSICGALGYEAGNEGDAREACLKAISFARDEKDGIMGEMAKLKEDGKEARQFVERLQGVLGMDMLALDVEEVDRMYEDYLSSILDIKQENDFFRHDLEELRNDGKIFVERLLEIIGGGVEEENGRL